MGVQSFVKRVVCLQIGNQAQMSFLGVQVYNITRLFGSVSVLLSSVVQMNAGI